MYTTAVALQTSPKFKTNGPRPRSEFKREFDEYFIIIVITTRSGVVADGSCTYYNIAIIYGCGLRLLKCKY